MAGDKGPFGMPGMQGMRVSTKNPEEHIFQQKLLGWYLSVDTVIVIIDYDVLISAVLFRENVEKMVRQDLLDSKETRDQTETLATMDYQAK